MFEKTRLQLTLVYLLILAAVSGSFSIVLFRVSNRELDRFAQLQKVRFEKPYQDGQDPSWQLTSPGVLVPVFDPALIQEVKMRAAYYLLVANGIILLVSTALSYYLAGRTLDPIKQAMSDQNRFISDASHELKTPLTSLLLGLEIYQRKKKPTIEQANELIQSSYEEVQRLQRLSESLLQISRSKNTRLRLKTISLDHLANEAVQKFKTRFEQKNITINIQTIPLKVKADKDQIEEVITNLIDNALKYSPAGTAVSITLTQTKNWAKLSISDQGNGISKKDLPHIFERFYRADSSRSGDAGFGLGLSITKEIVTKHGGRIKVDSTPQKGTVFVVLLPKA